MSNNNEQNGRQPPLPQYTAPPSDPRIKNASLSDQQGKICRDFVWGICTKGAQCKYQHELEFESMRAILKFCHDYQNRQGCTRPNCTYLHTSKEEEDLFLATGQIPRVLAERHAAMSSANMAPEGITPVMYEFMAQPPPPPPPAPLLMGGGAAGAPPPLPASLLAPPPPPPPPTVTSTPIRTTAPLYTAPPPHNLPAVQFIIDTSKPPPPLGTNIGNNGALKRPAEPCEAGPSKARKPDSSKVVDNLCGKCVQRELRIELYRQEMQKLECEKVCKSYILEQKSDAYDMGKLMLKSVLSPELYRILDEFIEGSTQTVQLHDLLAQLSPTPSFVPSSSTLPKQFLLQLADCNNYANLRNLVDIASSSSVGMEESSLFQSISALARRANPLTNHTSELQAVLEALRNSASSSERSQSVECRTSELLTPDPTRPSNSSISSSRVNGLNHFLNGQKLDCSVSATATATAVNNVRYASTSSAAVRTYPSVGVVGASQPGHATASQSGHLAASQSGHVAATAQPPAPASGAAYLPYNAAHPPPTARPYYPQSYGPGSAPIHTYNSTPIRVGPSPQMPARPSTSVPPPNPQNYNPYVMGRYPSQYYPPFQ